MIKTAIKALFIGIISLCSLTPLCAQSFWFGPKVGPTLAFQQWDGFDQQPILTYNGSIFIESMDPEGDAGGALIAQLGYFTRGSAIRTTDFFTGFNSSEGFRFNNLSLMLGAKGFLKNMANEPYYLVGVRVEYNLSNNLNSADQGFNLFFPIKEFTNKFTYGFTVGGGYNFKLTNLIQSFIEFSVNPDLRNQYQSAPFPATNPFTGQPTTVQMREIKNLSLELTVGLRFARKVTYID